MHTTTATRLEGIPRGSGPARTPAPSAPQPTPPARWAVLLRCVIAAVGMLVCATLAAAPLLIPAYRDWAMAAEARGEVTVLLAVETIRMPIALVLALAFLWLAARIEKVRLRDYFGRVRPRRAAGALLGATLAAVLVTLAASAVVHLSGADADRAMASQAGAIPVVLALIHGLSKAFLLQGIQEEMWFRGFAFRGYAQRPWFVLAATTIGFTVLHLASSGGQQSNLERVLYLALPFGMGLWAGVERWCTGTMWAAAGIHGGIHTGVLVASLLGWHLAVTAWMVIGAALVLAAVIRLFISRPWAR